MIIMIIIMVIAIIILIIIVIIMSFFFIPGFLRVSVFFFRFLFLLWGFRVFCVLRAFRFCFWLVRF